MRKTISASKDVSVLFITPGKAVWCSRFSAPLHSKKLTFESMVGRNVMLVKRLLSCCQLFLGKREVLNITIKGNNRKWDRHPVLFLQVLLGSIQSFAISKSVFFCYWNSLSVCHRTDVRQLLWRWVWRVWKWGWRCSESRHVKIHSSVFFQSVVCKASSSCCLSCR